MSGTKPISAEEAAKLLALPQRTRTVGGGTYRQTPGTAKTVRIDLDDRSWSMWWKLPTTGAECTVTGHNHLDDEGQPVDRNRMCVKIGEQMVCRYCYVTGRDLASFNKLV